MLVPLDQVIAAEVTRADLPKPARGKTSAYYPPVTDLERLRRAGRELDLSGLLPALLDGETPVLVRAALERSCVVELVNGERTVARVERLAVNAADVRWRNAVPDDPRRRYAPSRQQYAESGTRGRAASTVAKTSRRPAQPAPLVRRIATTTKAPMPPGWLSVPDAAQLAGVTAQAIRARIRRGTLAVRAGRWGERPVLRVRREDALRLRKAPA